MRAEIAPSRRRFTPILALVAGLACAAHGQDSTSLHAGLPGDAPDAYDTDDQCAEYVLDLVPISSSWGHSFTLGPLIKLSRSGPAAYFTNLPGASGISATLAAVPFGGESYDLWSVPSQGVSATDNAAAGQSLTPTGSAVQFAAIAADFAPVSGVQTGHVAGAVVRIDPAEPTRLYVQRRVAVTNGLSNTESSSSLSAGSVNERGQAVIRADAFGGTGPNLITGSNLFMIDLLDRSCAAINAITSTGGSDTAATTDIVRSSATVVSPASILPASVRSGTVFAADFAGDLLFGDGNSTATTAAHRGGGAMFAPTDHRGTSTYSPAVWFAGSAGTGAILSSNEINGPMDAEALGICYWGVDGSTGGVLAGVGNALTILLPAADAFGPTASVVDNFDGHEIGNNAEPGSDWTFDHIQSQTPFRGGNGQVGINTDADGRLLLAAHAGFGSFASGGPNSPVNSLVVARVSPAAPTTPDWTLAAWVDSAAPNGGKAITDGSGTVVGYIEQLDLQTGGDPLGPSMTSPAIDSAGNVWFAASARFIDSGAPGGFTHETALIRAVYDPGAFAYELEAVLAVGETVRGLNSARDYRITSIELADRDSVSAGAITSGSIVHASWLGAPTGPSIGDPAALGGLVFAASIIYDTNNDGQFVSPAGSNGTPGSPDEEYQALMFLGVGDDVQLCPGDIADDFGIIGPDGMVSFGDFLALLGLVGPCPGGSPGCTGDIADDFGIIGPDGMVSFGDFLALLGLVGPCP